MPEEKNNICEFDPRIGIGEVNKSERKGYNLGRQETLLAMMKVMPSEEEIREKVKEHVGLQYEFEVLELAQAIHKLIMGRLG